MRRISRTGTSNLKEITNYQKEAFKMIDNLTAKNHFAIKIPNTLFVKKELISSPLSSIIQRYQNTNYNNIMSFPLDAYKSLGYLKVSKNTTNISRLLFSYGPVLNQMTGLFKKNLKFREGSSNRKFSKMTGSSQVLNKVVGMNPSLSLAKKVSNNKPINGFAKPYRASNYHNSIIKSQKPSSIYLGSTYHESLKEAKNTARLFSTQNTALNQVVSSFQGLNKASLTVAKVLVLKDIFPQNYLLAKNMKAVADLPNMKSFAQQHTFDFSDVTVGSLSQIFQHLNTNNINLAETSKKLKSVNDLNINVNVSIDNSVQQIQSPDKSTSAKGNGHLSTISLIVVWILAGFGNVARNDTINYIFDHYKPTIVNMLAETGSLSPKGYVATTKLPVYSGHTTKAKIFRNLPFGEQVIVLKHYKKWSKIKISLPNNSYFGWVQSCYLDTHK